VGWNLKKVSAEAHADLTKSLIEFESVQIVRAYKVFLSLSPFSLLSKRNRCPHSDAPAVRRAVR
jgi:hypothetical protein